MVGKTVKNKKIYFERYILNEYIIIAGNVKIASLYVENRYSSGFHQIRAYDFINQ